MAHPGKRLYAVRRGPDGSAFQKCESCGLSVAIALADMHDCESEIKKNVRKTLKSHWGNEKIRGQRIQDQPRSAFHFFMEEFMKTCNGGNEVEINKKGFEKWKNMTTEEKQSFVLQANKLNLAYVKLLLKEESEMKGVDDEADSADVGKYDENYKNDQIFYDSDCSGRSGFFLFETYRSFDSEDLFLARPWLTHDDD